MPAPHHSVFLTGQMPFLLPNNSVKALKAIMLIHSWLKMLAVNLSWPTGWLNWVLKSLAGSKQTLFTVQILLFLPRGLEWVNVSSAASSPGLSQTKGR